MVTAKPSNLFTCPRCNYQDTTFHSICPECGRPFQRDYIDVRVHPRDPDLTGVCTSKFWAKIFLILIAVSAAIGVIMWFFSVFGLW